MAVQAYHRLFYIWYDPNVYAGSRVHTQNRLRRSPRFMCSRRVYHSAYLSRLLLYWFQNDDRTFYAVYEHKVKVSSETFSSSLVWWWKWQTSRAPSFTISMDISSTGPFSYPDHFWYYHTGCTCTNIFKIWTICWAQWAPLISPSTWCYQFA